MHRQKCFPLQTDGHIIRSWRSKCDRSNRCRWFDEKEEKRKNIDKIVRLDPECMLRNDACFGDKGHVSGSGKCLPFESDQKTPLHRKATYALLKKEAGSDP